jgi:glycosyltransferase involved in cell wall biosynthesis
MNKISVAMTSFNGEKYILSQLESIANQTVIPNEIIICDDKSTDNTVQIINDFKKNTNINIKIIINEFSLGFTQNFAKAIELCTGDIIFLADHDDVWFFNKIEHCLDLYKFNQKIMLIVNNAIITDKDLLNIGTTMLDQVISGYGTEKSLITGALTSFRKDFVKYFLPIPKEIIGHDICIHNIGILLDVRLVESKTLQFIRRHENNYSNWIASSITKINLFDVLLNQLNTKIATNYNDRLILNQYYYSKIKNYICINENNNNEFIYKSLKHLEKEYDAINLRNKLINKKGIFRLKIIINMLIFNRYKFFNGYRSFIRDLFRI